MGTRMQQRRATAAEWAAANPVLAQGEIGFVTDTKIIRMGDGVTAWNDLDSLNVEHALTAGDATTLQGNAPSAFLGAGATAVNSALLQGLAASAFLGAGAKAADSDKLDGHDSTKFLFGGVYATSAARTTAIPAPTEGMVTYLADNNRVEVYNGAAWEDLAAFTNPPYINCSRSANQSIATGTAFVPVVFDTKTEELNGNGYAAAGWTVPKSGIYLLEGYAQWTANVTGNRAITVQFNGTGLASLICVAPGISTHTQNMGTAGPARLSAGDVITVAVWQTSGGALNLTQATLRACYLRP